VVILTLVSLLVVYSSTGSLAYKYSKSTESYLFKQFAFIIMGVMVIYFAHRVNYTFYSRLATLIFLSFYTLIDLPTYFFGAEINDGSRWIMLPVINMTFQTSEFRQVGTLYVFKQTIE
jgi:cell division protein FtsW